MEIAMSLYSFTSLLAGGKPPQWFVMRGTTKVAGPFTSPELARQKMEEFEASNEREAALEEINRHAETIGKATYRGTTDGRYLGAVVFINAHYLLMGAGQGKLDCFDRYPLDEANIELILDRDLDFTIKDGKAHSNARQARQRGGRCD